MLILFIYFCIIGIYLFYFISEEKHKTMANIIKLFPKMVTLYTISFCSPFTAPWGSDLCLLLYHHTYTDVLSQTDNACHSFTF